MVEFKLSVSYKDGKSETITVGAQNASQFIGMKIGDEFDGSLVGKEGYRLVVTGGSDSAGFPMVKRVQGGALVHVSMKNKEGTAKRVLRRGSTITESIVQINAVALKKD
jgi:small subunit ribosomal protein S6e